MEEIGNLREHACEQEKRRPSEEDRLKVEELVAKHRVLRVASPGVWEFQAIGL